MKNGKLNRLMGFFAQHWRVLGVAAAALGLGLTAVSCQSTKRSVVMLPDVPGAKYIGSKECEQCHEEIYRGFVTADHAKLVAPGPNALSAGCESCHGPCSIHSESGGETKPPYAFASGRPQLAVSGQRLAQPTARTTEKVCFECHPEVRSQFSLPDHHPLPEGRMSCTQCHPPHKGLAHVGGGTQLLSQNDNCVQCHPSQRGPYTFEHEALREGCTTCHTPHGSINAKMLTVRDSNLCLKCHFQQVQGGVIRIGGFPHNTQLQQGTCWSAGCHEAVHGSRVNSSLRF